MAPYGRHSIPAKERKPRALRSVLGYAFADMPERYPMTPLLRGRCTREPSATPSVGLGSEPGRYPTEETKEVNGLEGVTDERGYETEDDATEYTQASDNSLLPRLPM
jgi:hypothetical protein